MNAPTPLPALAAIREHEAEAIEVRHLIHQNPELGFEETATSQLVAERLQRWGYEVHRGLGGTGVVGTLRRGEGPRLGLRADMDALPIQETSGKPWASKVFGKMHACGHDGHTAMLLAAARHLAAEPHFKGTLHLIFQPAEEGQGGARKMIEDGFFERFPCDAVFAMHNMPGRPLGQLGFRSGAFMASADNVRITVRGQGGHGAMPHLTIDAAVVASSIVMALQTVVSRNVPPLEMGVVSVGAIHAGEAFNVIADTAELRLSVRSLSPKVRDLLERRITDIARAQAAVYGAHVDIDYHRNYPVLVNHEAETEFARQVAMDWVGPEGLIQNLEPLTGSEDFAYFLQHCKGCYFVIGNGEGSEGGCMVHNPAYDFNDRVLSTGASFWVRLAEAYLR